MLRTIRAETSLFTYTIIAAVALGFEPIRRLRANPSTRLYASSAESWRMTSLADDKWFWDRLDAEMCEESISRRKLPRFETFCENYRRHPDQSSVKTTGQLLGPLGDFPLENARPIHRVHEFSWGQKLEHPRRCTNRIRPDRRRGSHQSLCRARKEFQKGQGCTLRQ